MMRNVHVFVVGVGWGGVGWNVNIINPNENQDTERVSNFTKITQIIRGPARLEHPNYHCFCVPHGLLYGFCAYLGSMTDVDTSSLEQNGRHLF